MKATVIGYLENILFFTGELDQKGNPVVYTSVKREHFKPVKSLQDKVKQAMRVRVLNKKDGSINILGLDEEKPSKSDELQFDSVFVDSDFELSENEKRALSYLYKLREELPVNFPIEVQEEFESLINYKE